MILRKVEEKTFRNAVVHITGNAHIGCHFYDCTFVFHGFPLMLDSCHFHGRHLWRIEFTVHDSDQWDEFMSTLTGMITKSLPKPPSDPAK